MSTQEHTNIESPPQKPRLWLSILIVLLLGIGAWFLFNQRLGSTKDDSSVVYILDTSARMALPAIDQPITRLEMAQNVLEDVINPSRFNQASLRVFGSGTVTNDCEDTDLVVPLATNQQNEIVQAVLTTQTSTTHEAAMARTIIEAIRNLRDLSGNHTLIVVTGGADTCLVSAGKLIDAEMELAGIHLQIFIIGINMDAQSTIAMQELTISLGDRGEFISVHDEATLSQVLKDIQRRTWEDSLPLNVQAIPDTTNVTVTTSFVETITRTIITPTPIIMNTPFASPTRQILPPTVTSHSISAPPTFSFPTQLPSFTPTSSPTPLVNVQTATLMPATHTPTVVRPTNTIPPTVTPTVVASTNTPILPTHTPTLSPPTASPIPTATNPPVPPTNTPVPVPSRTPMPPATNTPDGYPAPTTENPYP